MHYLDYNENIQHGTPDFPIGYYHVNEYHPRYSMPFHWHKELEIIRINEGRLYISLDDELFIAGAGDAIFINEGVVHGGEPTYCIYDCIVFNYQALLMNNKSCKQYMNKISNHQIKIYPYYKKEDSSFHRCLKRLFRSIQKKAPGYELASIGALYELFGIIFNKNYYVEADIMNTKFNRNQKKMILIKPVLEFIEKNYTSYITLNDLSHIAGMSPKYFCKYFRTVTQKTPMDYLNYYRIEHACNLLSTTDLTVTEISYYCGFNDCSYFIKQFKRYKRITPKQYSKMTQ